MTILITGICGFVGSELALALLEETPGLKIIGIDNLSREGSWQNISRLRERGIKVFHGDIRLASDLEETGPIDWVIDAAANASVLAGLSGHASSRQLMEHNLVGTLNLLELCKARQAGFIMLSTSRVYSIEPLAGLKLEVVNQAYRPCLTVPIPGLSAAGISEGFATSAPVSLYGASKLASEALALEYASAFSFPVWINRCGVMAGRGQFGRADQGIFSFWIRQWASGAPLKYIGFDGRGYQVRDCFHPRDLAPVLRAQMQSGQSAQDDKPRISNFAGGVENAMSLAQLSEWCAARFGAREVGSEPVMRPFDLPWVVLDVARAERVWGWKPRMRLEQVLEEIGTGTGPRDHPALRA